MNDYCEWLLRGDSVAVAAGHLGSLLGYRVRTHTQTHAYSCVGAPQLASRIKQEGANAPFDFL